jgi:hypothetical protein
MLLSTVTGKTCPRGRHAERKEGANRKERSSREQGWSKQGGSKQEGGREQAESKQRASREQRENKQRANREQRVSKQTDNRKEAEASSSKGKQTFPFCHSSHVFVLCIYQGLPVPSSSRFKRVLTAFALQGKESEVSRSDTSLPQTLLSNSLKSDNEDKECKQEGRAIMSTENGDKRCTHHTHKKTTQTRTHTHTHTYTHAHTHTHTHIRTHTQTHTAHRPCL